MKRRTFITALFATAAVAVAEPAQAIRGFRRRGSRIRGYGARAAGRRISRSRSTRYQNTSYSGFGNRRVIARSRVMGDLYERPGQQPAKPQQSKAKPLIDRTLPEFWKSPGEIDRPIVAKIQQQDIQGMSRGELTRKYGAPMRDESGSMTWNVGRTSDGIIAPQTFTVYLNHGKATRFQRGF